MRPNRQRSCPNCTIRTNLGLCYDCWRMAIVSGLGVAAIESLMRWVF